LRLLQSSKTLFEAKVLDFELSKPPTNDFDLDFISAFCHRLTAEALFPGLPS
jgi:hypothetical protein